MYGTLEQHEDGWLIQFVRKLDHPPEKVWRALTEPEHLAGWFPSTIEGERRAGAPLSFRFPDDPSGLVIEGRMAAFEPPSLLELIWGEDTLRFELSPRDGGTTLVLKALMPERGKTARDAAGWHACLDLLEYVLAGRAPDPEVERRWAEVHPAYVERLGPESATIGPPEGYEPAGA